MLVFFFFFFLLRLGVESTECGSDCDVLIHKVLIGRDGDDTDEYREALALMNETSASYTRRMEPVCNVRVRIWGYDESRALVARRDPEMASMLDRINRRTYAALVADVVRVAIVYEHGGWYQDASYEFSDPRLFCNIVKLYDLVDGVFKTHGDPLAFEALVAQNTTERRCGVAPAEHCIGTLEGPCDKPHTLERCQLDSSCVGLWRIPGLRSWPKPVCALLVCADLFPARNSSCPVLYKNEPVPDGLDLHEASRLVNNNFAVKRPYSKTLADAMRLIKERIAESLSRFDNDGRLRGNHKNECANTLHYCGTGGLSDAVLAAAYNPSPSVHRGIALHLSTTHDERLVFATWHGVHRVPSVYHSYNDFQNGSSPYAHWYKAENQPLFLTRP